MKNNRSFLTAGLLAALVLHSGFAQENNQPPDGFETLFNGQDLTGWYGRKGDASPQVWAEMSAEQQAAYDQLASEGLTVEIG